MRRKRTEMPWSGDSPWVIKTAARALPPVELLILPKEAMDYEDWQKLKAHVLATDTLLVEGFVRCSIDVNNYREGRAQANSLKDHKFFLPCWEREDSPHTDRGGRIKNFEKGFADLFSEQTGYPHNNLTAPPYCRKYARILVYMGTDLRALVLLRRALATQGCAAGILRWKR